MFVIHCPGHGAEVLLGPRRITALVDTRDGMEVHWRCYCGTTGVLHPHRRTAGADAASPRTAA